MRPFLYSLLFVLVVSGAVSCDDEGTSPPIDPGPIPPEPFPSCGADQICTFAISQTRDYTPAYQETLAKFDYVFVNKNSLDAGMAAATSPDVPVVFYEPLRFRSNFCDPPCPYEDWATIDAHEDWFWHDALGNRVQDGEWPSWYMDYRNTEYLDYLVARFLALHTQFPDIDGYFMDQHGPYSGFIAYARPRMTPGLIFPFPTEAEFDAINVAATSYVKSRIGALHMVLNSNCYPGFNGSVDGSMDEGFVHDESERDSQFRPEWAWLQDVNRLADASAAGKFLFPYTQATGDTNETRVLRFGLASYLLGRRTDGRAFYCFTADGDYLTRYFPEYDTPTGAPIGVYERDSSGLWVREYQNGVAVVHADPFQGPLTLALTGRFSGTFVDWDGICRQDAVQIPTNTGQFLLRKVCAP